MDRAVESTTRVTLLGRIRKEPGDPVAWREFVGHYGPRIRGWCRRWGLQDADADDVTQLVLRKLMTAMASFSYDPSKSFKAWLRAVTRSAWLNFLESERPHRAGRESCDFVERLDSIEAREDLLQQLDDRFDCEVAAEAMNRVRLRAEPRTVQCFELMTLERRTAREIARLLKLTPGAVYQAHQRVEAMLREEVERLSASDSE